MIEVEVLLTEDRLTEEFLAAFEQRYLPEKFFYWFPLSVRAWLDLCRNAAPYKNYSRSYGLISKYAAEVAGRWSGDSVSVISLGAGQGDKDLLLLEALRAQGKTVRYRPLDSSQALLEMALSRADRAGFRSRGLKADLASAETGQALEAQGDEPHLYLMVGNTIGATGPVEFLQSLRRWLRPEDRILLDGEIFSACDTMAGYENPVNRRFAFAPLSSLGLEEGRDGTLVFETGSEEKHQGLYCVRKHFRVARRLTVPLAGRWIHLEPGEKIPMSPSWKYSRAGFLDLLSEAGGLRVVREYSSDDALFLMVFAAPET